MNDYWKDIPRLSGYKISRDGKIISFWCNYAVKGRGRQLLEYPRLVKTRLNTKSRGNYEIVALSPSAGTRKTYYVHRLLYLSHIGEIPAGFCLDHIDGNRLNNTVENLRLATVEQNNLNSKKKGNNKYKGTTKRGKNGKIRWEANIKKGDKKFYLGCFASEEDAARAYDQAAIKLAGANFEFLRLNFIN